MTCLECNTPLSYLDHRKAIERFGFELCPSHRGRMERLLRQKGLPEETVILYYGLKEAGIPSMLAWWDGKQTVDLAISRVNLNIQIEGASGQLTADNALSNIQEALTERTDGFSSLRIPGELIRTELRPTVESISVIFQSLKSEMKAM